MSDSAFGPILFDSTGQAIYLFEPEEDGTPRCYDECAVAWPPVFTDGKPVAGEGIDPKLLGTVQRTDGRSQVTYGGWPLYFYVNEGKYEVECHNIYLNGGLWFAIDAEGTRAPV